MTALNRAEGGAAASRLLIAALLAGSGLCVGGVAAQPELEGPITVEVIEEAAPREEDGPRFAIGSIRLAYADDDPASLGLPDLAEFEGVQFRLLQTAQGYVAPRRGLPAVTLTLQDIAEQPTRQFYASALLQISGQLVQEFNRRGVIGVFIVPDELRLSTGQDARRPGEEGITLRVFTAEVSQVNTIASGSRIPTEDRINSRAHRRIRENSPVRPPEEGEDRSVGLLRRDRLDPYVLRQNRHPGRQVDVAIAPGLGSGEAVLDYYVYESKPWTVYYQLSNTGTRNTSEWRHRFGFTHNQLFGNDDILSLDYITAGFDDSHAIVGSYEAPFFGVDRLRWRVSGGYNEFTASDVGLAGEGFKGDGYNFGGELIFNAHQWDNLFVDYYAGARFQNVTVENEITQIKGDADIWYLTLGARAERFSETQTLSADAGFEFGFGNDVDEMQRLGRVDPDKDWVAFNWNARYSFYIEPAIFGEAWRDPTTPETSTLAHEMFFRFAGQHALGNRLIPSAQATTGGFYSVRGYDETVVASDNQVLLTAEYRFHVPRVFAINPEPRYRVFGEPFKFSPQQVYGRPDWDWILRGFADVGWTGNSDALSFEGDETLVGVGVGTEIQFKRNLQARLDWGFALTDPDSAERSQNSKLHFVLTLLY